MDITGRKGVIYNPVIERIPTVFVRRVIRKVARVFRLKWLSAALLSCECRRAATIQCEEPCDRNTKAILFAGGGIAKYRYQIFHDYIISIIRFADDDGRRGYAPTLWMDPDTNKLRRLGWQPAGNLSCMFGTLITSMRHENEAADAGRDNDPN